MTSFQVWAGVDTHGVSSLNIVSDSRITFRGGAQWDQGRKVYAAHAKPHVAGYWGDVLFPALALPQFLDQIEFGVVAARTRSEWKKILLGSIRQILLGYPKNHLSEFGLAHGYRIGSGTGAHFGLTLLAYEPKRDVLSAENVDMPSMSAVLHIAGSGRDSIRNAQDRWAQTSQGGTSRAAFSAFCESISSDRDKNTGGAPQLGSIYRIGAGRMIGAVKDNKRYFAGTSIERLSSLSTAEWRNPLFERVDGRTKRIVRGAQKHRPV